jgi:hypothetical protein
MRLQPGDRDTLGFTGNDPTHDLRQYAIFCVAARIPAISPIDRVGDDGLPVRMEKSARLASLDAAGDNWHRPGASVWLLGDQWDATRAYHDNRAHAAVHDFDGNRNGNFRDTPGSCDNFAHSQLDAPSTIKSSTQSSISAHALCRKFSPDAVQKIPIR